MWPPLYTGVHQTSVVDSIARWTFSAINQSTREVYPAMYATVKVSVPENNISAAGNTYKNVYEATSMHSGLILIFLANIITAVVGIFFYRFVIVRDIGRLTPDEIRLLRKYPTFGAPQSYTPYASLGRGAPPMRWTGWRDFFTSKEASLSRDAQVYLLFQRACILMSVVCALVSSFTLLPTYWFGSAVFPGNSITPPHNLMALLRSDRGIFERLTSHNLPQDSPLILLQLPVFFVVTVCIMAMYTVITTAAGESRSVDEWLNSESNTSASILPSRDGNQSSQSPTSAHLWTVFARGLPLDIASADYLYDMLDAIFPSQIARVELVCSGKMSEARLLRNLSANRHRLEYLYSMSDDEAEDVPLGRQSLLSRVFSLFTRRRTRTEMISDLKSKIEQLEKDLQSRKNSPVHDFRGCAFISFRTAEAAASALKDFPLSIRARSDFRQSQDGMMSSDNVQHTLAVDDTDIRAPVDVNHSTLSVIGEHRRTVSELNIPYFGSLCKATANLLPLSLRNRIIPSPTNALLRVDNGTDLHALSSQLSEPHQRELALMRLRNMKAERAPKSGDVIWQNLGMSFFERSVREMIVQIIVFAGLILFTSPVTMLTALKLVFSELSLLTDPQIIFGNGHGNNSTSSNNSTSLNGTGGLTFFKNLSSDNGAAIESLSEDLLSLLPSFLTSNTYLTTLILAYFPVLLLAFVFSIVPSLLRFTCSMEGYPTQSAMEMSVFRKTSFYYVMNSVVLPSLALNTASEFLAMVYKQSGGGVNVSNALPILQRLFSGDIAYFLCTYLVQLALTGSVFWLMRIPSSISMMIQRRLAVTPLEVAEAKCAGIFDYPRHYAYNITVISMVLLFGVMAPLMWWFALLYFLCKHAVDVYSLRYVHPRTHIDGRLPRSSSNFVLTWTIISQLLIAVILYLQGWVRAAVLTLVFCLLTLVACLAVPSTVRNRMISMVAVMRDAVLERMLRIFGPQYHLAEDGGLSFASNSSTSSQCSTENEALLRRSDSQQQNQRDLDYLKSIDSGLLAKQSSNVLSMHGSSNRSGELQPDGLDLKSVLTEDTSIAINPTYLNRNNQSPGVSDDGVSLDDGYDSDLEKIDEDKEDLDEAEYGESGRVRDYGTCDTALDKTGHSTNGA